VAAPRPTPAPLLDAATLRQLEHLQLATLDGLLVGVFGSAAAAAGANGGEFADHRPYVEGDDLRRIDPNVLARLDQAVVRLSPAEAPVGLAVLVDASASMTGAPARAAARMAAVLAAVALLRGDFAQVVALSGGEASTGARLAGAQAVGRLVAELEALAPRGGTDLVASLRAARVGRPVAALAVLVTDGLVEPERRRAAVSELAGAARVAALVHVVEGDVDAGDGPVELVDRETGRRTTIALDAGARARHAERVAALGRELAAACAERGVRYVALRADADADPLDVLGALPVVRRS
jgi:uncharacterized protein (DUF58 family)